ncbi:TIGR04141 family sporadically distributed protein [Actinoallomurus acanthiterrae]
MTVRTLYRLTGVTPDADGLLDALPIEQLDELQFLISFPEDYLGCPAILVSGHFDIPEASWCGEVAQLTGVELALRKLETAALLLIAVDGEVYAVGFDQGYRLVPSRLKDPTFGLRVAIRAIDPELVHDIVRRSFTGKGRQDATRAPSGLPIESVGIKQHAELVRELGGQLHATDLGLTGSRPVRVEGSAGLRLPIPTEPEAFLTCIRSIAKICAAEPRPDLAFIEAIRPVADETITAELDTLLDDALLDASDSSINLAVPVDQSAFLPATGTYTIRIGSTAIRGRDHLDLADIRQRVGVQHNMTPTAALRAGSIEICDTNGGTLDEAAALNWIETRLTRESSHYFLMEGHWYESGVDYLESIRRQIEALIPATPSITLPAWRKGEHERDYNIRAQAELGRDRFLCLDRTSVRTALHRHNGIEVCDGYGPAGELICIKPADKAAPLSHQFNQALVAVQTLLYDATARERFNTLVTQTSGGTRSVPPSTRPQKVIFGIHLKNGQPLTPSTLFPFAQIALINMAVTLRQDVAVEVIGIPAEK